MYQLKLFLSAINIKYEGNIKYLLNKRLWVASKISCTVTGLRKWGHCKYHYLVFQYMWDMNISIYRTWNGMLKATRKNRVHSTLHCRITTVAYCPKAVAWVHHDQGRVSLTQGHEEYFYLKQDSSPRPSCLVVRYFYIPAVFSAVFRKKTAML